ncbi:MAG: hypothetical protein KME28_22100 [Pelatocladus maniniholoensis HA4357-MV3]|jgi:hypothetical protein|uniref:Uncharacterized protein n=1 Tax=Pelatocladus maniniholoensis HA4357-MV3 TaxID=1117104 RepID=A0A9E3HCP2_9NOST|nr:hypothetical protein [Pelatocladus maniniholoensis HA4357-MV3]BAZ71034.1 hypothetical protein NIES4106_58310 [Fischerella sp. NIES-4106]
MEEQPKPKYRTVNVTVGKQPSIGPFPSDQLIPWVVISGLSYFLGRGLLKLNWIWIGAASAWGISTWWVLTANGAWRILSKFIATPNWVRVRVPYQRIYTPASKLRRRKSS